MDWETSFHPNFSNPDGSLDTSPPGSFCSLYVRVAANRRQVAAILPSIIIITLRIYLSRENKRRDKLEADNVVADNGLVETTNADGTKDVRVVDTNQLDLTDRENLNFRYAVCEVLWLIIADIC